MSATFSFKSSIGHLILLPDNSLPADVRSTKRRCAFGSASGDCRHDRDFGAVADRRVEILKKANVFAFDEDVYEAAEFAAVLTDAISKARVASVEVLDQLSHGARLNFDYIGVRRQLPQRRRYDYPERHNIPPSRFAIEWRQKKSSMRPASKSFTDSPRV